MFAIIATWSSNGYFFLVTYRYLVNGKFWNGQLLVLNHAIAWSILFYISQSHSKPPIISSMQSHALQVQVKCAQECIFHAINVIILLANLYSFWSIRWHYNYPCPIRGSTSAMAGPEGKGPTLRPRVNRGRVLLESFNEFLGESALHGVKYFIGTRWFVKVLWVRMTHDTHYSS